MSIFSSVSMRRPKLNAFDLSHEKKFSLDIGYLYPVLLEEIIPGDKFRVNTEVFLRMAPMLAPVMHRVDVTMHYFFVPNRLVYDEWEDFITGGRTGTTNPVAPFFTLNETNANTGLFDIGTLADFMGVPSVASSVTVTHEQPISALPFRAYQLIYNEFYRDQNLESPVNYGGNGSGEITNATDFANLMVLRRRNFMKDYFTSALPWAQRGADVVMPITGTGTADVTYKVPADVKDNVGDPPGDGNLSSSSGQLTGQGPTPVTIENIDSINVTVDSSEVTINDLRRSVKVQEWLERMARGGARYIEQIASQFGVISSDARLQRPEYLGGGKQPIVISEVLSTFQTETEGIPQGNMAGHGISVGSQNRFQRRFEEHGHVIGIMSVTPKPAYQQGICKKLQRFDKFDYAWPVFGNLGEQEINSRELYYSPTTPNVVPTFGYTPRYAEYKYGYSTVHGEFKTSLSHWHMGRIFSSEPFLNPDFVRVSPADFNRIFAVTDGNVDKMYCQLYHHIKALRPLPYYGTPSL